MADRVPAASEPSAPVSGASALALRTKADGGAAADACSGRTRLPVSTSPRGTPREGSRYSTPTPYLLGKTPCTPVRTEEQVVYHGPHAPGRPSAPEHRWQIRPCPCVEHRQRPQIQID